MKSRDIVVIKRTLTNFIGFGCVCEWNTPKKLLLIHNFDGDTRTMMLHVQTMTNHGKPLTNDSCCVVPRGGLSGGERLRRCGHTVGSCVCDVRMTLYVYRLYKHEIYV